MTTVGDSSTYSVW